MPSAALQDLSILTHTHLPCPPLHRLKPAAPAEQIRADIQERQREARALANSWRAYSEVQARAAAADAAKAAARARKNAAAVATAGSGAVQTAG